MFHMKNTLFINALISVRAEEIALRLDQIRGQTLGAKRIEIRKC